VNAVPTNELQVTGEVRVGPGTFEIRSLVAHGDGANAEFALEKLPERQEWALLLEVGAVRAGIRSGDGGTQFVLFNARPWFEAQAAALRALESHVR
jgi:hypothetical protein